jgi:hypothetical protein
MEVSTDLSKALAAAGQLADGAVVFLATHAPLIILQKEDESGLMGNAETQDPRNISYFPHANIVCNCANEHKNLVNLHLWSDLR